MQDHCQQKQLIILYACYFDWIVFMVGGYLVLQEVRVSCIFSICL